MTSTFQKIIFSFLLCLSLNLSPVWSFNQIPEELATQLDTLEGENRKKALIDWYNSFSVNDNPEAWINAFPFLVDELKEFYVADTLLVTIFNIHRSVTWEINNVVYFKETTFLLEEMEDILDELEKMESSYFIISKVKWLQVYARKLRGMSQLDLALEYYEKAATLAEEHNLNYLAHSIYMYYGDLILTKGDSTLYPKGLKSYEKSEKYLFKIKNLKLSTKVNFFWGKAILLENLKMYEESKVTYESYLDSLYLLPEEWGLQYNSDYINLLSKVGQIEKAINIGNELKQKMPPGSDPYMRMYFLEEFTDVVAVAGDVEQAIALQKEYKNLVREDNVGMGQEELLSWHTKYNRDAKQAELERLQLEAELSKTSFNSKVAALIAFIVLGITTLFFLLYKNRNKQRQLAVEVEIAQAVTTNRDRLFSSVTHDIRTPLALMLAPLERAEGKAQDSKVVSDLKLARKSGTQLMKIFTQILDWNKVETNVLALNPQIGNLDSSINIWIQYCEQEAIEKGVGFKRELDLSTAQYKLDFDKLEKILSYTFDHSLKYCNPVNQIIIDIQIINQNQLKLMISDDGETLPLFKQEDVVRRFFKRENRPSEKGLGLSLTIVRDMVHLMDGELKFAFDNNHQNTFEIIIPIEFVAETQIQPNSSSKSNSDELPTLLIVEDEPDLLRFLASALSSKFNIEKATSTTNGFILAENQVPDIIITDWNLPDNDGSWLIKKIKNNDLLTHIPIMVLTANNNDENKRMAFESGAIAWMSKPFQIKNLEGQLESILEQQKRSQEYWKHTKVTKKIATPVIEEDIDPLIKKVLENINKNYKDESFSVDQMAEELSINRIQLYRKTKKIIDKTPSDLIRAFRLEKAQHFLKETEMTVAEVAYATGFSSPNYFSSVYKKEFGINPSKEV